MTLGCVELTTKLAELLQGTQPDWPEHWKFPVLRQETHWGKYFGREEAEVWHLIPAMLCSDTNYSAALLNEQASSRVPWCPKYIPHLDPSIVVRHGDFFPIQNMFVNFYRNVKALTTSRQSKLVTVRKQCILSQCMMNPHRAVCSSYTRSPQVDLKQAMILESPQPTARQNNISCSWFVSINKTGLDSVNKYPNKQRREQRLGAGRCIHICGKIVVRKFH